MLIHRSIRITRRITARKRAIASYLRGIELRRPNDAHDCLSEGPVLIRVGDLSAALTLTDCVCTSEIICAFTIALQPLPYLPTIYEVRFDLKEVPFRRVLPEARSR